MTGVLIKREVTQRQGGREGHVKMEAETGVTLPQAKERLGPPGTRGGKKRFSPRGFGESMANTLIWDF